MGKFFIIVGGGREINITIYTYEAHFHIISVNI
jgi:hypothetical protein